MHADQMPANDAEADLPDSYELPRLPPQQPLIGDAGSASTKTIMRQNALWFCRIRWVTASIAVLGGILWWAKAGGPKLGERWLEHSWPLVVGGLLTIFNLLFLAHIRMPSSAALSRLLLVNLWSQILLDLAILTIAVNLLGSRNYALAFLYVIWIVIGCIILPLSHSFLVTLISIVAYVVSMVEMPGETWLQIVGPSGPDSAGWLFPAFVIGIWLVVWYLASRLSIMGRRRAIQLVQAKRRLLEIEKETNRYLLMTTHQLKSPVAAIYASASLLHEGYCGTLPPKALEVSRRIAGRCRGMAVEIKELLEMARLRSSVGDPLVPAEVDIDEVVRWCVTQIEPLARQRGVTMQQDVQLAPVQGVKDHLRILVLNVLSNAVLYSHEGQEVYIGCHQSHSGQAVVVIADTGIGIPSEKLPRIFDEYYRTTEAVEHNSQSSGLGLAIVRHIALLHSIQVRVQSQAGKGTTFELRIPPSATGFAPGQYQGKHEWAR